MTWLDEWRPVEYSLGGCLSGRTRYYMHALYWMLLHPYQAMYLLLCYFLLGIRVYLRYSFISYSYCIHVMGLGFGKY